MPATLERVLSDLTMPSAPELVIDEGDALRCVACGHRCRIAEGKSGVCRVRRNVGGQLRVPAGYVASVAIDPIEKKPFYHVFPGSDALSFGMLGCDLHCSYCQNWITSQALRDDKARANPHLISAEALADLAVEHRTPVCVSTYNEPLITADWAVEVFKLLKPLGVRCGFVSNGNGTPEVLRYLRPYVDLYKVDLKCFDDRHYRRLGCALKSVLDTIVLLKELNFWVEVVTLVVPTLNDTDEQLNGIARFLAGVDPNIPWHVTAFHPDYKLTDPPATPIETLIRAHDAGLSAGLKFVYTGNRPGRLDHREDTFCPRCCATLIRRWGFTVRENRLRGGHCPDCDCAVPGVWA